MAIKPDAYTHHFIDRPKEHNLAVLLGEAFDITSASNRDNCSIWIADPKQHTKERFGLHREVLVVYSPHQKTDARTLTAIDRVLRDSSYRHRLDRVIALLIHHGDQGEAIDLVNTDQDRMTVAIHADQLLDPGRGSLFVRQCIAKRTGEIDLFGKSSPISADRYFFGRDNIVQTLLSSVARQGENSGLFGLRKTGKTSVLKALQRKAAESSSVAEYIDCSNPGLHAARWWDALETVVERLAAAVEERSGRTPDVKLDYSQSSAGFKFLDDVRSLLGERSIDTL